MQTVLRVGVVGCGRVGKRRAEIAAAGPSSRLVCVADLDPVRAQEVGERLECAVAPSWHDLVARSDVDAVVVATSHDGLARISRAALVNGKHVLCEKPLGRSVGEVAEVVATARERRLCFKAGFNHRHHPAVARAHALAREGAIGSLVFARCRYGHGGRSGYESEWRGDAARAGGGELLDQGVHALDLFRWFFGEFAEAAGFVATAVWKIDPLEDNAFALFRTSRGQVACAHVSWTQWRNLFSLEIYGQDGALSIEGLGGSYGVERLTWARRRLGGPPAERCWEFPGPDGSWAAEWREFVRAIVDGCVPLGSGEDGLAVMRMVAAVYESDRRGVAVRLLPVPVARCVRGAR